MCVIVFNYGELLHPGVWCSIIKYVLQVPTCYIISENGEVFYPSVLYNTTK